MMVVRDVDRRGAPTAADRNEPIPRFFSFFVRIYSDTPSISSLLRFCGKLRTRRGIGRLKF